jgi:uncharacterized lipoprotein YddW (UPF0748 family)
MTDIKKICLVFIVLLAALQLYGQVSPKREMRAAWIATVMNIDWPTEKGMPVPEQQQEFIALLDQLQDVGMNAVIVQVRPTADAFYASSFDPWSEYLTGSQGKPPDPYYDPLTFMIQQARLRGMEFHAWFNPYRVSMKAEFSPSAEHVFNKHRDWFLMYGGKWYFDPGHPDAREYVLNTLLETVRHYDLDAVHFDDYFYPYRVAGEAFTDDSTYARYGAHVFEDRDDWRRANVDYFIETLSARIKLEKPHVKFGISPFGVWRNKTKDPRGSDTQAGQTNYDDLYADVLKWLEQGWIDYIAPQVYWHIGFDKAEYKTLVKWWSENSYGRHVYIGQGIYRVGEKGWEDPDEIVNQLSYNRSLQRVGGSMFFSAKVFMQNKRGVNEQLKRFYGARALVPRMEWKSSGRIHPPQLRDVKGSPSTGLTLQWTDSASTHSAWYVIYRYNGLFPGSQEDASSIVAVVPREPTARQIWTDTRAKKRATYTYLISSADRLYNESLTGNAITIKTKGRKRIVNGR